MRREAAELYALLATPRGTAQLVALLATRFRRVSRDATRCDTTWRDAAQHILTHCSRRDECFQAPASRRRNSTQTTATMCKNGHVWLINGSAYEEGRGGIYTRNVTSVSRFGHRPGVDDIDPVSLQTARRRSGTLRVHRQHAQLEARTSIWPTVAGCGDVKRSVTAEASGTSSWEAVGWWTSARARSRHTSSSDGSKCAVVHIGLREGGQYDQRCRFCADDENDDYDDDVDDELILETTKMMNCCKDDFDGFFFRKICTISRIATSGLSISLCLYPRVCVCVLLSFAQVVS